MDLDGVLKHHSLEGPSLAPPEHFSSAHLPSAHLPSAPASCSASRKHREEKQLIEATRENFQEIARAEDIFEDITLTADAGFHTEANMKRLFEDGIDGYVADTLFRKRDPRFAEASRYKEQHHRERREVRRKNGGVFTNHDFHYDPGRQLCICPAGKKLYRNGSHVVVNGYQAVKFRAPKSACRPCHLRT